MQWMGVASLPRGARGSPLFYQLHKTAPLLTITLCHYEANSQLAMHTQPQVQQPSAYWSLHFNLKKKKELHGVVALHSGHKQHLAIYCVSPQPTSQWSCYWQCMCQMIVLPYKVTDSARIMCVDHSVDWVGLIMWLWKRNVVHTLLCIKQICGIRYLYGMIQGDFFKIILV